MLGEGQSRLKTQEFRVAALVDPVRVWNRLEHEDRADFGQGTRILGDERVGHRRDERHEAMIAFEAAAAVLTVLEPPVEELAEVALARIGRPAIRGGYAGSCLWRRGVVDSRIIVRPR